MAISTARDGAQLATAQNFPTSQVLPLGRFQEENNNRDDKALDAIRSGDGFAAFASRQLSKPAWREQVGCGICYSRKLQARVTQICDDLSMEFLAGLKALLDPGAVSPH